MPNSAGISSLISTSARMFLWEETVLSVLPFLKRIPWLIAPKFFKIATVSLDNFIHHSIIKIYHQQNTLYHVHIRMSSNKEHVLNGVCQIQDQFVRLLSMPTNAFELHQSTFA